MDDCIVYFCISFITMLCNKSPQTSWLKATHIHYLTVLMKQDFGHSLTGALLSHPRLQSWCRLVRMFTWRLEWGEITPDKFRLLAEFISLWLYGWIFSFWFFSCVLASFHSSHHLFHIMIPNHGSNILSSFG